MLNYIFIIPDTSFIDEVVIIVIYIQTKLKTVLIT